MSLEADGAAVAHYAEQLLPLSTASLGDEYRYQSLSLCVIDAVFSLGIKYGTVQQVVARYCDHTKQRRVRASEVLPPTASQESITTFCDRPEQIDPASMADRIYRNHNLTSPRSGILKAEAVARFARCLQSYGVEYLQDVHHVADDAKFEKDVRDIRGQGSGLSLNYFWMLTGSDQFIKADRMVLGFLAEALARQVSAREALPLLRAACKRLAEQHPNLTPRLLDHEVWKHQRAVKSVQESGSSIRCRKAKLSNP